MSVKSTRLLFNIPSGDVFVVWWWKRQNQTASQSANVNDPLFYLFLGAKFETFGWFFAETWTHARAKVAGKPDYFFKIWPFTIMIICIIFCQKLGLNLWQQSTLEKLPLKDLKFCQSGQLLSNLVTLETAIIWAMEDMSERRWGSNITKPIMSIK